jgi:virulence-associated protein VagC
VYILNTYIPEGTIMADMVTTKLFRTGGSVALRIPAGWMDPAREVTLVRDRRSGRIYLTQNGEAHPEDFFQFLRGQPYEPDPGFDGLGMRDEPARQNLLEDS